MRKAGRDEEKGNSGNLRYGVKLLWDKETGGRAYVEGFPPLLFDRPVKFGGKSRFPCPDHYFFSAVGGCVITTFLFFRGRLKLKMKELQVSVQGEVNSVGPEGYRVANLDIVVHVGVDEGERSKAEKCAELAREFCHLTRSLERGIPVSVKYEVGIVDSDEK